VVVVVEGAHGVADSEEGNTDIGEHGTPKGGKAQGAGNKNYDFHTYGAGNVLTYNR
jgi:hypothetical protein